jgi:hypothetical protein
MNIQNKSAARRNPAAYNRRKYLHPGEKYNPSKQARKACLLEP